jgi:hypothetical protein
MTGDLAKIYGERLDMIPMLKSADAPGASMCCTPPMKLRQIT